MNDVVALPQWLLLVLIVLAAWAVFDHLLRPLLSWVASNRGDLVIEEVSDRLRIGIRPFQRTPREALIGRLVADPRVLHAAEVFAAERHIQVRQALATVERYAREIVPAFNAYLYFRIGYWLGRRVARRLYRVRVGSVERQALARVNPNDAVVFVMNHRSNMDYILVGYVVAEQTALSYAVGEWAQIWPLSTLIRAMGAYFVRRNSRDELYRRVLERYIAMATEAGVPQAVFPEGGLSRDGTLREPKLGVLDYMMRGFRLDGERDLVFVPIGLNYDRVLEDRTQLLWLNQERPQTGRAMTVWRTARFFARNLRQMMRSEWHRFGYACMNIGEPISTRQYCRTHDLDFSRLGKEERRRHMATLGHQLMDAVRRVIPVLPVPLIATVFVQRPSGAFSELELKAETERLVEALERAGARIYIPRRDLDYAITVGLRMLRLRRLVDQRDGLFSARQEELPVLSYYANSIGHLLAAAEPVQR
jgi:glycerol-3-phosphate O-acyltransferase